jgi:hypothetical protein
LQALQRLRYPSGRFSHLFVGARHLVHFLERTGLVAPSASSLPPPAEPALLGDFRRWMQTHRGTTQATLNGYRLPLTALLNQLGDQPECFEAQALRAFVLEQARQGASDAPKPSSPRCACFCAFASLSAAVARAWITRCPPLPSGA